MKCKVCEGEQLISETSQTPDAPSVEDIIRWSVNAFACRLVLLGDPTEVKTALREMLEPTLSEKLREILSCDGGS